MLTRDLSNSSIHIHSYEPVIDDKPKLLNKQDIHCKTSDFE